MGSQEDLEKKLVEVIKAYHRSFSEKVYNDENNDSDLLMDVFGITPELKRENRQYWGRELGMCWELLVVQICRMFCDGFKPALRVGADEPCDLLVDEYAIDTKYRIGSGDSGTLKKFKIYGKQLRDLGHIPVFLILREDNLPAAIKACEVGTWEIYKGDSSLDFVKKISGFDITEFLRNQKGMHVVNR